MLVLLTAQFYGKMSGTWLTESPIDRLNLSMRMLFRSYLNIRKEVSNYWDAMKELLIMKNKEIWSIKGLTFSFYATNALILPFLPILFEDRGFNASQIGLLMTIGPFVTIFAQPLWGYLSDRYQKIKLIIFLLCAMTLLSSIGVFQPTGYPLALLFMTLIYFFQTSAVPILDSLCIKSAQKASVSYGSIRLYGSIGFTIVAVTSGLWLQAIGGLQNLGYLYWAFWILPLIFIFFFKNEKVTGERISLLSVKQLIVSKKLLWFFFLIFIMMIPQRMSDGVLVLYLVELGAENAEVGWAWALVGIGEVITFSLLGRFLHKYNELIMLGVVSMCYTIRWALYGLVSNPLIIVALQLLTLVTWAAFWIVAVQYVTRLVPEALRSTGQAMLSMVFLGICGITGGNYRWLDQRPIWRSLCVSIRSCHDCDRFGHVFLYTYLLSQKRIRTIIFYIIQRMTEYAPKKYLES